MDRKGKGRRATGGAASAARSTAEPNGANPTAPKGGAPPQGRAPSKERNMREPLTITEHELPPFAEHGSPFLCSFCEDIKLPTGSDMDMQRELDVCRRCVRIDRSVRFADYLLIQ
jgi:hypothetical protein